MDIIEARARIKSKKQREKERREKETRAEYEKAISKIINMHKKGETKEK